MSFVFRVTCYHPKCIRKSVITSRLNRTKDIHVYITKESDIRLSQWFITLCLELWLYYIIFPYHISTALHHIFLDIIMILKCERNILKITLWGDIIHRPSVFPLYHQEIDIWKKHFEINTVRWYHPQTISS